MKVYSKFIFTTLFLAVVFNSDAQFQKKFTIDVGVSPLFTSQEAFREDGNPYLFSNFKSGYGVYGNLLYNPSRKISIGIAVNLSSFRQWQEPRKATKTDGDIDRPDDFSYTYKDKSYFNVYSIDPNVKYKLFVKRISPFVMAGLGVTVYHAKRSETRVGKPFYYWDYETYGTYDWVSIDYVISREPGSEIKPRTAFNLLGAAGFDIKVSETVGITLMACYNYSFTAGNFTLDQNLKYLSFPIGVNLSLGKSKTL